MWICGFQDGDIVVPNSIHSRYEDAVAAQVSFYHCQRELNNRVEEFRKVEDLSVLKSMCDDDLQSFILSRPGEVDVVKFHHKDHRDVVIEEVS